jgi:ketosteroid isomerase-like protein
MGQFTRDELEEAFAAYQQAAAVAGATGDWAGWADQFTDDATYVEHHYGRFEGREAIREWITETMGTFPGNLMPEFPIDWYVIDEDRGWIVCQVENRMADPGDGSIHQGANITILHYAGDGKWSYEEDVYNPAHFATMVRGWKDAKEAAEAADAADAADAAAPAG